MKRLLYAFLLICTFALPACQCDDPPEVAPVEGEAALVVVVPEGLA